MVEFSSDDEACHSNGAQSSVTYDTELIRQNPQDIDETQMFNGPGTWAHVTDDFPTAAMNHLPSAMIGPLPVSPPLTDASNDVSVASACSQSGLPMYMVQDEQGFVEMSPGSSHHQTITLESPFLAYTPPSGQDQNRLAISTRFFY